MSTHPQPPPSTARKPVTLPRVREMRAAGEPIAMLTCYDASFAVLLDEAGVALVGQRLWGRNGGLRAPPGAARTRVCDSILGWSARRMTE